MIKFGKKVKEFKLECPICGSEVDKKATECPECGEELDIFSPFEEGLLVDKSKRKFFYAGLTTFLIGVIVVFSSILHDAFGRHNLFPEEGIVPGHRAYWEFGPLNMSVIYSGIAILSVGIGFLVFAFKKPKREKEVTVGRVPAEAALVERELAMRPKPVSATSKKTGPKKTSTSVQAKTKKS